MSPGKIWNHFYSKVLFKLLLCAKQCFGAGNGATYKTDNDRIPMKLIFLINEHNTMSIIISRNVNHGNPGYMQNYVQIFAFLG